MHDKFDIITIGYIFNENIQFPDFTIGPLLGGTVSYSAVVLGRLGVKTGIVSNVGRDIPESLLQPIYCSSIDTSGLHIREDSPTTTNILIYDKKGNKTIKYLKKAPQINIGDIPEEYFNTKIMFFCPVDFDVSPETVRKVKQKGLVTAADMGGFGGAHNSEESRREFIKGRKGILGAYTQYIDIAKVSMEDCCYLFGGNDFTESDTLKRLLDTGIKTAILTLGEKGALIATNEDVFSIPPVPVKVVDATGAGDVFMAAFLSEYIRTDDLYKAGMFASAASSLLIEKTGGVSIERIPDRKQVMERMECYDRLK